MAASKEAASLSDGTRQSDTSWAEVKVGRTVLLGTLLGSDQPQLQLLLLLLQ